MILVQYSHSSLRSSFKMFASTENIKRQQELKMAKSLLSIFFCWNFGILNSLCSWEIWNWLEWCWVDFSLFPSFATNVCRPADHQYWCLGACPAKSSFSHSVIPCIPCIAAKSDSSFSLSSSGTPCIPQRYHRLRLNIFFFSAGVNLSWLKVIVNWSVKHIYVGNSNFY